MRYCNRALLLASICLATAGTMLAEPSVVKAAGRDVTFISTSDSHYDAFESEDRNARNRETLLKINAVEELKWPQELGGGQIARPRGVLLLGDVIDDGDRTFNGKNQSKQQYEHFLADFGLDGTDGRLKFPVFEGWGNHDGPPAGKEKSGFSFQAQLKQRNALRKQKGLIGNLSDNGLHYSWDWDDVHFVQLNLYPADRQNPKVRYSPEWHDPQESLAFLKKDLAEKVGASGRPVVLASHCGFDTDWWNAEDWKAAYDAAKAYNVVLYLYGHSGTGVRQWAPEGEARKWLCINDGQLENGFFVIQITENRLRAAYRCKESVKRIKNAEGKEQYQWDGTWGWRWTLDKELSAPGQKAATAPMNLASVAKATTSFVSGHETIAALNDGFNPAHSDDKRQGAYGNWPQSGTQWVQYEWTQPITTAKIDVYWFDDQRGVRLPNACRLTYWDGKAFVPVERAEGLGLAANRFNTTTFSEVSTTKVRLEMDSDGKSSTGILEWRVYDSGKSPNFAPAVEAGVDRAVMLSGKTWLSGSVRDDGKPQASPGVRWSKRSGPGPGEVTFSDPAALNPTATFSAVGKYVLQLTADDGQLQASDEVLVTVDPLPPSSHLHAVSTAPYAITSPLWRDRVKQIIVHWIPHCVAKINDPAVREGGIDNFVQAGNKLAGRPHKNHVGACFANTWVYNTVESMCVALMVDPQDDPEIVAAQKAMRATLDDWIPKILSAQEPDGYLHTQYTLQGHNRWSNKHDHEGYQAGYFIEAALTHYQAMQGKDSRMLDAAIRLADCWCANIGPAPKRPWYDGHQALEMALVRLARFVEQTRGSSQGAKYLELAKFLLDSRRGGEEYDQSHLPVVQQYEAVGHAVRAVYSYAGMADVAMETGDVDYHSAVKSLWNSIVNRKYYVTGGVGSGETSEGFGKEYSLPNNGYCESCAGCGELFFQHRLQLTYHDSRYADLYEETLYNAILGGLDLEGRDFFYTNGLDAGHGRYPWHVCPCCVGNLPRTLLQLPTWMYSKGEDAVYVNLYLGSDVNVGEIAGTNVRLVQSTDYPWSGKVSIVVQPAAEKRFTIKLRAPNRTVSELYANEPQCGGILALAVNGKAVQPALDRGYASIARDWKPGDRIDLELPMEIQRVRGSEKIAATRDRVALRRGPLLYNIESVDQNVDSILPPNSPLSAEWNADLLHGVLALQGKFADGKPMTAIPNYARLNRGGRSIVWIKER